MENGEIAEDGRRFALPPASAEVFTDRNSMSYLAPLSRQVCAAAKQLPGLLSAYRDGGGVGWAEYGVDAREGQADMNRPWFEHALAPALAGIPALDGALRSPGARIADIGCGSGILICLPDGMSHSPSVGTGTVMRTSTLRGYAKEAGFTKVEVLPITDFGFWRFYHLTP